jgi:acyl dehydratase
VIEAGQEYGPSAWLDIAQARIDAFAEVTEDRQSIHIDPAAAAASPFGTTVAHGFLTLSLLVHFWNDVAPPYDGVTINYGLNKVRFPAPVPSGSRVRGHFKLLKFEHLEGGAQLTYEVRMEREGSDKPVCVAESVGRRFT